MATLIPKYRESPSQTAGPYVHIGCAPATCGVNGLYPTDLGSVMLTQDTPGERIRINGQIFDGRGDVLTDALVEVWQADHTGQYATTHHSPAQEGFTGWGRQITDLDTGQYSFEAIKPGAVCGNGIAQQAPHVSFWIVARGINLGLNTRMYFPDEGDANAVCPVLQLVPEEQRQTLVAQQSDTIYTFDIHLQGPQETVFFDI